MTNNFMYKDEKVKLRENLYEAYKENYISEDQKFLNNIIAIFRDDIRIEEILWSRIRLMEYDYNIFKAKVKNVWPNNHPLSLKEYCSEIGITNLKNIPPKNRGRFYSNMCAYLTGEEKRLDDDK